MPERPLPPSDELEELLELLDPILDETDLATVLARGAALLASAAKVETCALYFGEDGHVRHEAWFPEVDRVAPALRAELGVLGRRALSGTRPCAGSEQALHEVDAQALTLLAAPADGSRRVVIALANLNVRPPDGGAVAPERLLRLARLLGRHVDHCDGLARARAVEARNDRWFKRLDEQVRVLDRERQKFAAMVSQTDSCVFVTDPAGTIHWANPALAALAHPGDGDGGWVGRRCRDFCGGWDGGCHSEAGPGCPIDRALERGETVHQELHSRRENGTHTLYLTALPIKGPDGKPHEVMVAAQDLSDLDVLRRSETRYRRLFERNANTLLLVDPTDQRILLANATAGRVLGCRPKDLAGLTLAELHDPAVWSRMGPGYARILLDETPSTFEVQLRARDGGEKLAEVSATRLELEGQVVSVLELRDITESRRVELALRQTEERLRTVVASSPVVLFALDRDGIFTLSEGRGLDALGLSPGESVGRSVYEAYRNVPELHEHVRRALAGEEVTAVVDVGGLAFESRYVPLRDSRNEVVGLIGVATDVTERRRLEDQLRHSQKMDAVGRLAGGVAHDFNNLLTAMLGSCELLLLHLAPHDPLRRYAEEIQKGGVRGSMLTRQLLAFGRRELLAPRILDVRAVVSEMDYMLKRLVGEDVNYTTRFAPETATVRADQGQIEQVLMNLVVNARDAMPDGGRLTVEVSNAELDAVFCQTHAGATPGSYVLMAVSDTGCGMAPEDQARIYEPFFTTKARGQGTGLGLSTVYGIVTQWGGHIDVYSEPGNGSAFKVYLPRTQDEGEPGTAPPEFAGTTTGCETILLVEDEETVRGIAREILELHGYSVIEAEDGAKALSAAEAYPDPIHLVLTDVVMPNMSGGRMVERLVPSRPDVRVLFMSGYPDDAVVRNGLLDASAEFVQKPFSLEGLVRRVREVLDGPRRN